MSLVFSIAMCTFNGGRFLPEQLESFLTQTTLPRELIISDDASTDDTLEIANRFARDAPFEVRVYQNPYRLGVSQNFELAVRLSRSEFVALSDQDDVWMHDKLQTLATVLTNDSGISLVFSDAEVANADLHVSATTLFERVGFTPLERQMMCRGRSLDVLLRHNVVTGATMAFRRSLIDRVLPIEPGWVHDAWIAAGAAAIGKVAFVELPLIHYRQHDKNVIGVGPPSWQKLRQPRAVYRSTLANTAPGWDRLARTSLQLGRTDQAQALTQKADSLRRRASLPAQRYKRLPWIMQHLATGGYRRYARGWRSAIRDLVI